jgi:hypothetical protein
MTFQVTFARDAAKAMRSLAESVRTPLIGVMFVSDCIGGIPISDPAWMTAMAWGMFCTPRKNPALTRSVAIDRRFAALGMGAMAVSVLRMTISFSFSIFHLVIRS